MAKKKRLSYKLKKKRGREMQRKRRENAEYREKEKERVKIYKQSDKYKQLQEEKRKLLALKLEKREIEALKRKELQAKKILTKNEKISKRVEKQFENASGPFKEIVISLNSIPTTSVIDPLAIEEEPEDETSEMNFSPICNVLPLDTVLIKTEPIDDGIVVKEEVIDSSNVPSNNEM